MEVNKLWELQKEIRSKIPRLMEVSEGFNFSIMNYEGSPNFYRVYNKDKTKIYSVCIKSPYKEQESVCITTSKEDLSDCHGFKIGHPILLSDVRDWGIKLMDDYIIEWYPKGKDLFSNLIHQWKGQQLSDQSEELINYLHSLIKYKLGQYE